MSTVEVPLTKGKVAIIDEEDAEKVAAYTWCANPRRHNCYALGALRGRKPNEWALMHRLLMGAKEGQEVDHIDGNGLNNTKANLRLCTPQQNRMNMRKLRGKYKYKCVKPTQNNKKNPWEASIGINGKRKHLGSFPTEEAAARAYDAAAKELFGEFANLNFP